MSGEKNSLLKRNPSSNDIESPTVTMRRGDLSSFVSGSAVVAPHIDPADDEYGDIEASRLESIDEESNLLDRSGSESKRNPDRRKQKRKDGYPSTPLVPNDPYDMNPVNRNGQSPLSDRRRKAILNVVILGLGSAALFTGFNPIQAFMTTLNKDLGFNVLTVIYASFALSNFFSPFICQSVGVRVSLIVSSLTYVFFLLPQLWEPTAILILPLGAILGFGASIFWTAQGTYLMKNSHHSNRGFMAGLFSSLFMIWAIAGNLLAHFLQPESFDVYPQKSFFIPFVIASACGSGLFLLLGEPVHSYPTSPLQHDHSSTVISSTVGSSATAGGIPAQPSAASSSATPGGVGGSSAEGTGHELFKYIAQVLDCFSDVDFLLLCPIIVHLGFSTALFFAKVPPQMASITWIPFSFISFGIGSFLGSVVLGHLSDRRGRVAISTVALLLEAGSLPFAWYASQMQERWMFFGVFFLFGVADGALQAMLYAAIGSRFLGREMCTVASMKIVQSLSTAIVMYIGQYISFKLSLIVVGCPLATGLLTFVLGEVRSRRLAASGRRSSSRDTF